MCYESFRAGPLANGRCVAFDAEDLSERLPSQKRDTRPKCSPRVYNAAQNRETLNATLDRRTMTLPDGTQPSDMDTWMIKEMVPGLYDAIVWDKHVKGEPQDMATSVFEEFQVLKGTKLVDREAFSLGTAELCGCTTLIIISRRGVYMGHYWESISFNPDKVWLDHYGDKDKCFEKTVIDGLTSGVRSGGSQEQVSLKGQASKIEDQYIKAYLMIPTESNNDVVDGYRDRWTQMKDTVNEFVPTINTPPLPPPPGTVPPPGPAPKNRWTEVKYDALNNENPLLQTTARGRVLFKFDPNENGKKRAALWVEQNATPYHNDVW